MTRDEFFELKEKGALWDVGVSINRTNPLPLDKNAVFKSLEEAQTYVNGVLSYPGQVLAVVEADKTTVYYIDETMTLQPVGSATSGDSLTIDLDESTKELKLHDFGKYFYQYVEDEGNPAGYQYVKTEITEENKPKMNGLEPKIVATSTGYELAWYEPNKTTIEGVSSKIATLETAVNTNTNAIQTLNGDGESSVNGKISSALSNLSATDSEEEGKFVSSVKQENGKITVQKKTLTATDIPALPTSKIEGLQTALDGKQDTLEFTGSYDASSNKVVLQNDLKAAIDGLTGAMHYRGESTTDPATGTVTVEGYDKAWVSGDVVSYGKKEFVYDETTWRELGNEGSYAVKGSITNSDIATDAAIDQSKISGLTDTLNKKLEGVQVDGNDLTITSNKVNIPKATADALGLVKSSTGANKVSVNSDGTMSVSSVNASSIVSDTVIRISGGNASTDFSSLI